jgi:hypothetical protein
MFDMGTAGAWVGSQNGAWVAGVMSLGSCSRFSIHDRTSRCQTQRD